jgi:membrane protein DedA with SNARE-associated domain
VAEVSLYGDVQSYIATYGYFAVSGGILLEDFGLPTPGETLLIAGAMAAAHGTLDITWLLLLAWAGAVVGDSIGWAIGRYGGRHLAVRYGNRVGITSAKLQQVERFFDRHGDVVIIFARFVVMLRQLNGIVAGTLAMPWPRFLLFNAIGAALWVGWWGMLAYWLGQRVLDFISGVGRIEPLLFAIAALALAVAGARIYWRRRGTAPDRTTKREHDRP